jgi:hypothetical protein
MGRSRLHSRTGIACAAVSGSLLGRALLLRDVRGAPSRVPRKTFMSLLSPSKVLTCTVALTCFACRGLDAQPLPQFETSEGDSRGGEGGGPICVGDCTMPPFQIEVERPSPSPGIPVDISAAAAGVCTGECTMPPLEIHVEPPPDTAVDATAVVPEPHRPCPAAVEPAAYSAMVNAIAAATNAREAGISDLESWYAGALARISHQGVSPG